MAKEDAMEKELRDQIEAIKTSKMPEKEKPRLIALAKERASEERKLQRMPREERLKKICGEAIESCCRYAFEHGAMLGHGDIKPTKGEVERFKFFRTQTKSGLTLELKRAGVLPLEG
jgi:hypothetical protein